MTPGLSSERPGHHDTAAQDHDGPDLSCGGGPTPALAARSGAEWSVRAAPHFTPSPRLSTVLENARAEKFIGANITIDAQVANGIAFAAVIGDAVVGDAAALDIADLGSGGGIPALVIAEFLPATRMSLIERSANRAQFLRDACIELGLTNRVDVIEAEAEDVARNSQHRGRYDVVTARSFAAPAVTAETASALLRTGGVLLVSEPPPDHTAPSRWPSDGLAILGYERQQPVIVGGYTFQPLRRSGMLDERIPRRGAAMRKRPLF